MKRKVKLSYPEIVTTESIVDVEIPDGDDPQEWLNENAERLMIEARAEEDASAYALEYMGGGATFVKEPNGTH